MRTLYHYPLCPFSRKVRLLLAEKKLDVDPIVERPWDNRDEFMAMNPSGQVPVLVDMNGSIVCESYAITEYLETVYPDRPFLGHNITEMNEVRRLISWFDWIFYRDVTHHAIYEKITRRHLGDGHPNSGNIRLISMNIHPHLDTLAWLVEHRNWMAGKDITLADFTAASHLSCLDYLGDVPWERYPLVKDWYTRIKSRPSFRPLLDDTIPGHRPSDHYANLDF